MLVLVLVSFLADGSRSLWCFNGVLGGDYGFIFCGFLFVFLISYFWVLGGGWLTWHSAILALLNFEIFCKFGLFWFRWHWVGICLWNFLAIKLVELGYKTSHWRRLMPLFVWWKRICWICRGIIRKWFLKDGSWLMSFLVYMDLTLSVHVVNFFVFWEWILVIMLIVHWACMSCSTLIHESFFSKKARFSWYLLTEENRYRI